MSSNTQTKPDLGLLEEDDEFEEFPAEGIEYIGLVEFFKNLNFNLFSKSKGESSLALIPYCFFFSSLYFYA